MSVSQTAIVRPAVREDEAAPRADAIARTRCGRILQRHLDDHVVAVDALRPHLPMLVEWGTDLAERLLRGQRLLAAGNGGSAAEAQHLTAEIVGRFDGERRPFAALSLHAETSSVTAIANDYGYDEVFARQVQAHARTGDVLMLFSTSGRSQNLIEAARAGHRAGASVWTLCGPAPNPLVEASDEHIALAATPAGVQEAHLLALHLLCRAFDDRVTTRTEGAA